MIMPFRGFERLSMAKNTNATFFSGRRKYFAQDYFDIERTGNAKEWGAFYLFIAIFCNTNYRWRLRACSPFVIKWQISNIF